MQMRFATVVYYAVQHLLFSCVKLALPGLADFSAERYTPGPTIGRWQQVRNGRHVSKLP